MASASRRTVLGDDVPSAGYLFALAARTASPTADQLADAEFGVPDDAVGITVLIDTTAIGAAPSTTFTIQGWNAATSSWFDILVSPAVVAVSKTLMKVDPRITAGANTVAQQGLVPRMRVVPAHGNGNSHTYAVSVFAHA